MISPISQNNNNKTQASIFYMNDFHAKLPNLERLYSASKAFDSFETTADKMKGLGINDLNLSAIDP